jgi:hypothetical protein
MFTWNVGSSSTTARLVRPPSILVVRAGPSGDT